MAGFSFFPCVTQELEHEIGLKVHNPSFSYNLNENIFSPLEYRTEFGEIYCSDERGIWNIKDYNLIFKSKLTIEDSTLLFGNHGVAPTHSVLGVALLWSSKKSNSKGAIDCGTIEFVDENISIPLEINFEKSFFRDTISVKTVIYLKESTIVYDDEKFLCSSIGSILYDGVENRIVLEGDGSVFPIIKHAGSRTAPLWEVVYNSEEPQIDPFNVDYIAIKINEGHPSYKELNLDAESINEPKTALFKEVFQNAIFQMFLVVCEQNHKDYILDTNKCAPGSICEALGYMAETFDIDMRSYTSMFLSISKIMDARL